MSNLKKFHVPYGMTPNNLLNHKQISLKAKGLFSFMQSKPENWKFSAKLIATQCKESLDSILSGLKELEDFGYLEREKKQTSKGFTTIYHLHESPVIQNDTILEKPRGENPVLGFEDSEKPRGENPTLENPTLENPTLENPTLENTPLFSNKEESKKEEIKKEKREGQKEKFLPPTLPEVIQFFQKGNFKANPENFFNYWESVGWKKTNGLQIVKWQSLVKKWDETEKANKPTQSGAGMPTKKISPERKKLLEDFNKKTRGWVEQLQTDASAMETARIKFNQLGNYPNEFNSQAVYLEINAYQIFLLSEPHRLTDEYLQNLTIKDFKINFVNWFNKQKHSWFIFSDTPNKHYKVAEMQE